MQKPAAIMLVAALGLAVFAGPAPGEIIRLRNGIEVHCEVLKFDAENGVTIRRCDNGGVVALRWEHIIDADVAALKAARGYTDMEPEPILIRAQRLFLASGDHVIGVQIESARPEAITLRRLGKDHTYLQSQVTAIETIEVEARAVYTLGELYEQKIGAAMPRTALDHFKLAVFCESVADYARALEHFRTAAKLDPGFKPDLVAHKIERMHVKQAETGATGLLDEIQNKLYRKKFALALELCDRFAADFQGSRQRGELENLRGAIAKKRHAHFQQQILGDYFIFMDRIAMKIASDRTISYGNAIGYTQREMAADIRAALAKRYGMEIDEIDDLWQNRGDAHLRSATYGAGTFILGNRSALLPREQQEREEKEEEKKAATADEQLRRKIEKLKQARALQLQQQKRFRSYLPDVGRTMVQWWLTSSVRDRKQHLCAYFAEYSDDLQIRRVRFPECATCAGRGWFEYFPRGEDVKTRDPCPICKTLGFERMVYFN